MKWKKLLKKIKENYKDILAIGILSFLLTLSLTWDSYSKFSFSKFVIFLLISIIFTKLIWQYIDKIKINKPKGNFSKKELIAFGIIIFIVLAFAVIAYYPGYVYPDSINIYWQAALNNYSNWHPVLYSYIMFHIPLMIYRSVLSVTIFQCIIIWGILLYFCYFCRKNFLSFKGTLIALLLIVFNPLFIFYSVALLKDVIYSWHIFLSILFLIDIYISNGEWFKKVSHKIVFIICGLAILFFRHNGIVPVSLMYISLLIFYPKYRKQFAIILVSSLSFYFIVTGPVFKALNISSNGGKTEMVGEIIGQISNYYHRGLIKNKDLDLLEEIAPLEVWDSNNNPRSASYIKYNATNWSKTINKRFNDIIILYIKTSFKYPSAFISSFLNMTSPTWETTKDLYTVQTWDYHNDSEISSKGNFRPISEKFMNVFENYSNTLNNTPFRWLFVAIGEGLLIAIFSLFIILKKSKGNIKSLIPYIPLLVNSLVMMLLITGGETRYVYSQTICVLPLMICSLSNNISQKESTKKLKKRKIDREM